MVRVCAVLMVGLLTAIGSSAAVASPQQQPQTAKPPAPAAPGQKPPAPGQPAAPQPAAPTAAPTQTRTFSTPGGLIFTPVRPERVADFEKVMAYFQAALAKSTDATVREQAAGWRIYKATETAQGGVVLYVYVLDPAMMGPDYGIGKILADAYPNEAEQLWKLYRSSVAGGGTLLNLTPVMPVEPPPLDAPVKGKPTPTPAPAPTPTPQP
jgi:hypothetical protein